MRVCITGIAGQIGSHLAEALIDAGCGVIGIDNLSTGRKENLNAARDLAEHRGVYYRFRCCNAARGIWSAIHEVDYVFHLAACVGVERVMEHPELVLEAMHECTRQVVNCCVEHDVPMLCTSSSEVYGRSTDCPFREDQDLHIGPPTEIRWSYALVKLLDEFLVLDACRRHGLRGVVVRLFNTVSPRQCGTYGMVLPRFVEQAKAGKRLTIHGSGAQTRCFSWIDDVTECLLRLSRPGHEGEVFNVGSTEEVSIQQLAYKVLCTVRGMKDTFDPVQDYEFIADRPADMARRVPDVTKLTQAIGYVPNTSLSEIVKRMVGA